MNFKFDSPLENQNQNRKNYVLNQGARWGIFMKNRNRKSCDTASLTLSFEVVFLYIGTPARDLYPSFSMFKVPSWSPDPFPELVIKKKFKVAEILKLKAHSIRYPKQFFLNLNKIRIY